MAENLIRSTGETKSFIDKVIDVIITLLCWAWFIFGFILIYSWVYIAGLLARNTEVQFQRINCSFFKVLFRIINVTAPGHIFEIDERVRSIRSSIIVCNHLSYLDPLVLISLFKRSKTIVKPRFFNMLIFGSIVRKSGYIPASGEGRYAHILIDQVEAMDLYLKSGGNLFVFPEGTRSRDGKIGKLNTGVLKIARMCKSPIQVLNISGTDALFPPGSFNFNTRLKNKITLKVIGTIAPDFENDPPTLDQLEKLVFHTLDHEDA